MQNNKTEQKQSLNYSLMLQKSGHWQFKTAEFWALLSAEFWAAGLSFLGFNTTGCYNLCNWVTGHFFFEIELQSTDRVFQLTRLVDLVDQSIISRAKYDTLK